MPDIREPSPTDLSQARIAELLQALTSGPIGDAILGLVRGEKRLMIRPYESLEPNTFVVTIEDKLRPVPRDPLCVGAHVRYGAIDCVIEAIANGVIRVRPAGGSPFNTTLDKLDPA